MKRSRRWHAFSAAITNAIIQNWLQQRKTL